MCESVGEGKKKKYRAKQRKRYLRAVRFWSVLAVLAELGSLSSAVKANSFRLAIPFIIVALSNGHTHMHARTHTNTHTHAGTHTHK